MLKIYWIFKTKNKITVCKISNFEFQCSSDFWQFAVGGSSVLFCFIKPFGYGHGSAGNSRILFSWSFITTCQEHRGKHFEDTEERTTVILVHSECVPLKKKKQKWNLKLAVYVATRIAYFSNTLQVFQTGCKKNVFREILGQKICVNVKAGHISKNSLLNGCTMLFLWGLPLS